MKVAWTTPAVFTLGSLLWVTPGRASIALYTNSPCVYLITSNGLSQAATLLGPTGSVSGSLSVPLYVKSSLFNVTAIAPGAFKDCVGLTALTLDASSKVKSIGAGAFWGCTNLSLVTLRDSVTDLGASVFLGCAALTNVNLSVATGLTAVAEQTFCGCSALASVTFPSSVTNLGDSAFRNCSALSAIAVPPGVSTLPAAAFQGCRKLASATFSGATLLGDNTFASAGLTAVTIPSNLTNIAQGAFADCTNLIAVTYAGSPATIGSGAFKNCSALTNLPVAASLTDIASTAFDGCVRLTSATLPSGVRDIANNLFENCTALVSVAAAGTVTNVGEFAFANTALTVYSLPTDSHYRSVDTGTFYGCSRLASVTVPTNVVNAVKAEAFAYCTSLVNVSLTNSHAEAVNARAFYGCTALKRIALPPAVKELGSEAFGAAPALTNVTSLGNAPTADVAAFAGSTNVFVFYCKGSSGWGNLLACRPTVMLGSSGSVEALSFAAWAVKSGLSTATGLSDATLATLFEAESSSVAGLANGEVYAFGGNLTTRDRASLLQMVFDSDGTPIVETPALDNGAGSFVTVAVEGTTDLKSGRWDLTVSEVTLPDATRAGYTPAKVNGALPGTAFFRLKIALGE